jgi:hypothetical protein
MELRVIDQISSIADNIQSVFEELIKQVLMKNLRPVLKPSGNNAKSVYNAQTGRNQTIFSNCRLDSNVNKYTYRLTYRCLGWTGDFITNFDARPRAMKNSPLNKHPVRQHLGVLPVTYNDKPSGGGIASYNQSFDNLVYLILENSMLRKITNVDGESIYNTNVRFSDIFKFLSLVGEDIVSETDPELTNEESARLRTAMLRYQLAELEISLDCIKGDVFDHYVAMVRTINKTQKFEVSQLITLLGQLNFTKWEDLCEGEREYYTETLGTEFMEEFLSNKLITFLLNHERADLILTSSYLFSLCKMLFVVFGFDANAPIIVNFDNKYRNCQRERVENYARKHKRRNVCDEYVDIDYYDYIEIFYYFYPTLCDIINSCDCGCEACDELNCSDIPRNFDCLGDICQMIWRYYDFSYCVHLQSIYARVNPYNVNKHINVETKYLFTL